MKTSLALLLLAALIQVSIAPTVPAQGSSKTSQSPLPEDSASNDDTLDKASDDYTSDGDTSDGDTSDGDTSDGDTSKSDSQGEHEAETEPFEEDHDDPNHSPKFPSNSVSSPNRQQPATPGKAASSTVAVDKTGSLTASSGFSFGSLISSIAKVPYDLADQTLKAATKLEELPLLGGVFSLGNSFLRGGLNLAHNIVTNPIGTVGAQIKNTGTQMQSHLDRLRSWRQSFGSTSTRFATPGTASDSDSPLA